MPLHPLLAEFMTVSLIRCPATPGTVANQVLGYYKAAQAFIQLETGTVARTGDEGVFFPKLDWVINNKNTFTASYNRMCWNSPNGI